jgi:hypothetical protein
MQYGIIHYQIKMFDQQLGHNGIDITVSAKSRHKKSGLELSDYDLLNNCHVIMLPDFPAQPIADLFDKVICKYCEHPKLEEIKQQADVEAKEIIIPVNGKVIKGIRKFGDKHEVLTHDANPSKELQNFVNKIIEVKGGADIKLKEQITKCANKLRVGTLDMTKDKSLHVHTEASHEPFNGRVTRKQLVATLWFISKCYMQAPSFRKYLTVSVSDGKYTCGYQNGEPYFKTDGLSDLEKSIVADLKLIKE